MPYKIKLLVSRQVDMEETIAHMIFNTGHELTQTQCVKLSQDILEKVLKEFRPDLLRKEKKKV